MAAYRTLDGVDVAGKRVLMRADLNVPLRDGRITDLTRLERLSPTIVELSGKGAKVIVLSHFDRPKGKRVESMSLRPVAGALGEVLGREVGFVEDCVGDAVAAAVGAMQDGDVLVLENTRFHEGEEANDVALAMLIATHGEMFVNDAFSAAHRAHATTEGIARLLPSYAGRLMQAELDALNAALGTPQRPVGAIVGGSKVSTKLDLLTNLITKVDLLVIGGAMANTFLAAQGAELGKSLQETALHPTALEILAAAEKHGCRILLPVDFVVSETFAANPPTEVVSARNVPANAMALDVGPATTDEIIEAVKGLKTLIWNGPLGAFETPPFDTATMRLAAAVAEATEAGMISVGGGGDTVAALKQAGIIERMTYVSSAGGAFLEWMEGKALPGVAALAA
ncbi:phosphoglycerate kinase [Acidiphilium acidophilum]|uniref:Phosphoglycerate kinase n=1 Tax=Acidiphilium acidophilum TaxID=76588 RepID=A0AAW9DNE6_ACIAO|nr:phosphoglycerate kinase [Acidiphilium acidophilum]MDX5929958.1 phosphoglycerate kinase [Acidiphilium acidophilum]MEE3503405.1 phosphoglycerate kinase [Acidiphilium acidophilum]GBQ11008.1 phosphoglycerate kinase [Acidiphilium acidophilum DSM 700]